MSMEPINIFALIMLIVGLALIFWRNKRVFDRKNTTTKQSYTNFILIGFVDWLIYLSGILCVVLSVSAYWSQLSAAESIVLFIVILCVIETWKKIREKAS